MAIKENVLPLAQDSGSGYIRTVSSGGVSQRTAFDTVKGAITADMDEAIADEADAREAADDQLQTEIDGKVDKVTGKGLSTNDFTDALKTKLDGIEAGAEVNVIETVKVNGTALVPDANRAVNVPAPTVDSALSTSSTNPVQNKVITGAVNDLKEELNNKIDLRTTEHGSLTLTYLNDMTMNTSGVIYASEGKKVVFAKVCKDIVVSFFANSGDEATAQLCRYGLYATTPAGGSTPTYGYNSSSYSAEIEQDCYIAFTHPSVTSFSAKYVNNDLKKYKNEIEELAIESLFNYHQAVFTTNDGVTTGTTVNTDSNYYKRYTKAVTAGEMLEIAGVNFQSSSYPLYILKNGSTIVSTYHEETLSNKYMTKKLFIPDGVDTIVVNDSINYEPTEKRGIFSPESNSEIMEDVVTRRFFTSNNNVLWIGTSIPEGATYPKESCKANGYKCINKSLGSSKLCFENSYISGADNNKGKRLTATVAELEALYRNDVTNGVITEATLTMWKNYSYENSIIPYIDGTDDTQVSMVVIDHGFNDRGTIYTQMQDIENIDWTSTDRSTFTGAFKYLLNKMQEANPFIKVVISGYFTNTVERLAFSYYSSDICNMQTLIGEHYNISVMKAWEHSQINPIHVSGTNDYISNFNTQYGTSYTKITPDANGNITALQLYCPDGMHPHSDKTGNTNKRLNAVYSKLLSHLI